MQDPVNYETWLKNALTFIQERGLEVDFKHWCGGWPCPVKPGKSVVRTDALVVALENIQHMHDGNQPAALNMPDLDYARRVIQTMNREAREALEAYYASGE